MPVKERCKVLIVDDEVLIRQGIKHYVKWEQEGFEIVGEAANGKEALQLIEQKQPHIVITDIVMPVMDGEELTRIIKTDYPHIQVIVLSSFSDFDYVRSTFQHGVSDYILKPKMDGRELLKALKNAASSLTSIDFVERTPHNHFSIDHIIESIMSGYPVEYDEQLIKDSFPEENFSLLHIGVHKRTEMDFSQLEEKLIATWKEYFIDIPYRPIEKNKSGITFIVNYHTYNLSALRQKIKETSTFYPDFTWTFGEPFQDFKEIKRKYDDQLLKLIACRYYLPEKAVLFYDELPASPEKYDAFDLHRFIEVFKHEQFTEAFDYLKEHIVRLANEYTKDEHEFKSFLGNIIFNITVLLGNLDYDNKGLDQDKYNYFTCINETENVKDAIDLLNEFLDEVNKVIEKKQNDPSHSNIQKLLNYIDAHFAEPLSLTDLANHFHFNPSYLSTYFSTHHRVGFNEYINEIRIEKAKELLRNGTVSISKISGMAGYSDHSYFCKVFKKKTGKSPSSYRRSFLT